LGTGDACDRVGACGGDGGCADEAGAVKLKAAVAECAAAIRIKADRTGVGFVCRCAGFGHVRNDRVDGVPRHARWHCEHIINPVARSRAENGAACAGAAMAEAALVSVCDEDGDVGATGFGKRRKSRKTLNWDLTAKSGRERSFCFSKGPHAWKGSTRMFFLSSRGNEMPN